MCFSVLTMQPRAPPRREYSGEVDSRGEAFLSQRPHHPGGKQERPAERRAHTPRARQDEAGAWRASRCCEEGCIYAIFTEYGIKLNPPRNDLINLRNHHKHTHYFIKPAVKSLIVSVKRQNDSSDEKKYSERPSKFQHLMKMHL